jgi:hypothetical protein
MECSGKIDPGKRNGGHSKNCKAADLPPDKRAPGKPRVKISQHRGVWKKGRRYVNEAKLRVQDWTCQTCGRTATTLDGAGEPQLMCPEVRGR